MISLLSIVQVLETEKLKRQLSRVLHEYDRLRFALTLITRNFTGFCCLCDLDPDKTGEECPVKAENDHTKCLAWLVDSANKQREAWYRDIRS